MFKMLKNIRVENVNKNTPWKKYSFVKEPIKISEINPKKTELKNKLVSQILQLSEGSIIS